MKTAITKMDPQAIERLRAVIEKELTPILDEYGVTFKLGNARYDDDSVKFTGFRIALQNAEDPTAKALEAENKWRRQNGIMHFDLDKIGSTPHGKYTLVGFKPRNRKYPFICLNLDNGGKYKFSEIQAERMFGAEGSQIG